MTITDPQKQKEQIRKLKSLFRTFFEGCYETEPLYGENGFPVSKMEITDLGFVFKDGVTEMTVTLGRPGLLIGKGGRTLFALEECLSDVDQKVKILIIESTLWRL